MIFVKRIDMRPTSRFLVLALLCLTLGAKQSHARDSTNGGVSTESASASLWDILPCADQSWQAGNWEPVSYERDLTLGIERHTPEGKRLALSTCAFHCLSVKIVDLDNGKQRVLTSVRAQRQECEHQWRGGFENASVDPIRAGDLLFVAYRTNLHIVAVEEVLPYLRYRIATMAIADSLPPTIDLASLQWQKKLTDTEISIPGRSIPFHMDAMGETILVVYDTYYGYTGIRSDLNDDSPAFMAIVHKSDLADKNMVELARFSFKTWEDGLGNLCPPRVEPLVETAETQTPVVPDTDSDANSASTSESGGNNRIRVHYQELHQGPIWAVGCPADSRYIVTAGHDGRIVLSDFVEPIRIVVGPFGTMRRFYALAASRDGHTVIAGGDFQSSEHLVKFRFPEMILEFVSLPPGTGTVETMSSCEADKSFVCLTSPGNLTIVGEDGSAERFQSPAQWFMLDGDSDSIPVIIDTPCESDHSTISPDCGFCARLCTIKREPVGYDYALIVFDHQGQQTVCHKSNRFSPSASRCVFIAEDHLVLFLSYGGLMEWKFSGDPPQWQLQRTLRTAAGPFSAGVASPESRSVWLARESIVFEVDLASGATRREVVLKVGESPNDPDLPIRPAPAVTDLEWVPRLNLVVAALRDGRIALIDLSEREPQRPSQ